MDAAAFSRQMKDATGEERTNLRRKNIHLLRTAFAEIRFTYHQIDGLIELPGKPRMKTGIPRSIHVGILPPVYEPAL